MIKTASFALVHFSVGFAVVYALTGSIALGGLVALVEPACNTIAYAIHEKLWEHYSTKPKAIAVPVR